MSSSQQMETLDKSLSNNSICIGGRSLGPRPHVCAFFSSREEEYRLLLPFVKEGLENGERAFHTVDPDRRNEHLEILARAGIDVAALGETGQFEIRDWSSTHLLDGYFEERRTLDLFKASVKDAESKGYPLTRFVTHMEWALEKGVSIEDLLAYEARANESWLCQEGMVNPVICTYDLRKFTGDVVIDVMRTHPMIIIGGILQENPFFVLPDQFLRELNDRRSKHRAP